MYAIRQISFKINLVDDRAPVPSGLYDHIYGAMEMVLWLAQSVHDQEAPGWSPACYTFHQQNLASALSVINLKKK